jgi:hypothetical protein
MGQAFDVLELPGMRLDAGWENGSALYADPVVPQEACWSLSGLLAFAEKQARSSFWQYPEAMRGNHRPKPDEAPTWRDKGDRHNSNLKKTVCPNPVFVLCSGTLP